VIPCATSSMPHTRLPWYLDPLDAPLPNSSLLPTVPSPSHRLHLHSFPVPGCPGCGWMPPHAFAYTPPASPYPIASADTPSTRLCTESRLVPLQCNAMPVLGTPSRLRTIPSPISDSSQYWPGHLPAPSVYPPSTQPPSDSHHAVPTRHASASHCRLPVTSQSRR